MKVFARDLVNPRVLAVSEAGILYATRRSIGDVEREGGGYGYLARLSGIAVAPDGALFVGDNSNGVVHVS